MKVRVVIFVTIAIVLNFAVQIQAKGKLWINPLCSELAIGSVGPFIELDDGSLMVVGKNITRITKDNGKTWSEPKTIYNGSKPGIPVTGQLIKTRNGVIILVYQDFSTFKWGWSEGKAVKDVRLDVWAIRSLDGGKTWVDRQMLLDGYCGDLIDIIQTKNGNIVIPVQNLVHGPDHHAQYTYVSSDDGKNWRRSNIVDVGGHGHHDGSYESTLVELKDGRLWMLLRTNLDRFWQAYSEDGGLSWRTILPSNIDASSSPGYITRLASGRLVLVWNRLYPEGKSSFPRKSGDLSEANASWHREEVSIAFSEDEGKSWSEPIVLARQKGSWLSYTYLYERQPGLLWITTRQGGLKISVHEKDLVKNP